MNPITIENNQAEILARAIDNHAGGLSAEIARFIVSLELAEDDACRMNELAAKARDGHLTADEEAELEEFRRWRSLDGDAQAQGSQGAPGKVMHAWTTSCGNWFAIDLAVRANTANSRSSIRSIHFKSITSSRRNTAVLRANPIWLGAVSTATRTKARTWAGWIAETDEIVRLYHPRKDTWSDHFQWSGASLIGRTPIGLVTINVLRINHPDALAVRRMMLDL